MLRWVVFLLVFALIGAVVWAAGLKMTDTEILKIAVFFLLVAIILAIIYIRSRSRRRRPPPV
jgi:uncharacterized membrane protein YfcA